MIGVAAARAVPADAARCELGHVLAGVMLDGPAARLAQILDPAFLAEAGWDPDRQVLSLPAGHRLLGRAVCRVGGCATTAQPVAGVCFSCLTRLTGQGLSAGQITQASLLPPLPARAPGCAVPGCLAVPTVSQAILCEPHARQFRHRVRTPTIEQFLADPRVRPLLPLKPCAVVACTRTADGAGGLCNTHYQRWRTITGTDPDRDLAGWQLTDDAVTEGGRVSLRGLPPLVAVQVLFGIWQRTRSGAKITDVALRGACRALSHQQVTSIEACDVARVPSKPTRSLLSALARHVRRALSDPASEQAKDVWDLAIFGHPGRLSFTGISQSWLREAAKHWAAEDLPRHRGSGATNVRAKINALTRLSESLRCRPDHGDLPAALGRADIENFLSRLGYLESAGTISRYQVLRTDPTSRARSSGDYRRSVPPAARPQTTRTGGHGTSRFSRTKVPHMPWFSDRAGPPDSSRVTLPAVLPSAFNRAWAPRSSVFRGSIARPARTPVNASPRPSQDAAHDSGPPRVR